MTAEQLTLSEAIERPSPESDTTQCQSTATRTGDRCQHDALPGVPYCVYHYDRYDPSKSDE